MHKNIRSSMLKPFLNWMLILEIIMEKQKRLDWVVCMCASALSGCVRWNVQLVERFLCGNELIFIHPTTSFYVSSRQKHFCAAWSEILCIRSAGSAGVPHLRARVNWADLDGWAGWGSPLAIGSPGLPIAITLLTGSIMRRHQLKACIRSLS